MFYKNVRSVIYYNCIEGGDILGIHFSLNQLDMHIELNRGLDYNLIYA